MKVWERKVEIADVYAFNINFSTCIFIDKNFIVIQMAFKINKQSWIQLKSNKDDGYNLSAIANQNKPTAGSQLRSQLEIAH